jgi:nitroreductase
MIDSQTLSKIVESGTLAPSVDNNQPWHFQIKGNSVNVCLDICRTAIRDFTNRHNIADLVSIGAAIENMRIAGSFNGFNAELDYDNDLGRDIVAKVSYSEQGTPQQSHELYEAISQRRTNRYKYDGRSIDPEVLRTISDLAKQRGANLQIVDNEEGIRDLAETVSYFDQLLWCSKTSDKKRALLENMRMTRREAQQSRDGLSIDSLGLNRLEKFAFKNAIGIVKEHPLLFKLIGAISKKKTYGLIKSSPAVFAITMPESNKRDYVQGGEVFENIWLYLTSQGIDFHPMVGAFFSIAYNYFPQAGSELGPGDRDLIGKMQKGFEKYFDISKENALIAFVRIGYAVNQDPRTLRRDPKDVIHIL